MAEIEFMGPDGKRLTAEVPELLPALPAEVYEVGEEVELRDGSYGFVREVLDLADGRYLVDLADGGWREIGLEDLADISEGLTVDGQLPAGTDLNAADWED